MSVGTSAGSTPEIFPARASFADSISIWLELSKARLSSLVLVTTTVGFFMAPRGLSNWPLFLFTLLGTALSAAGANAFNQWWERDRDARMERTRRRPIPSGRIGNRAAVAGATLLTLAGGAILAYYVNLLTASLSLLTVGLYVLVYTPLKLRSPTSTLVGAICGAIPPMMGWTAATGRLDLTAWILGAVLFVWQIPHFLALAWIYRRDYARGGFRVLTVVDRSDRSTCQLIVVYCLALIPVAWSVCLIGVAGWAYAVGGFILGLGFLAAGIHFCLRRTETRARRLFLASVIYLPLLLGLMVADRRPTGQPMQTEAVSAELAAGEKK